MPVTAVQILNNQALPFFEEHDLKVQTILSDNGREYCGRPDKHPYELFLQLEEIEHRSTKVGRPQSDGSIERFHHMLLEEHPRIKGRTTWYETVAETQRDLDAYLETYKRPRPHRSRGMKGRSKMRSKMPESDPCAEHCWAAPGKKCYRCGRIGEITRWWRFRQWIIRNDVLEHAATVVLSVAVIGVVLLVLAGMFLWAFAVAMFGLLIRTKHL